MATAPDSPYCTVPEAARILRVIPTTVWRWIQEERLPAYRVGQRSMRIRKEDLEAVVRPAKTKQERPAVDKQATAVQTIPEEELAGRRAVFDQIMADREKINIAPLTSADLLHMAREKKSAERREYVGRVVPPEELVRRQAAVEAVLALRKECSIAPMSSTEPVHKGPHNRGYHASDHDHVLLTLRDIVNRMTSD